MNNPFFSIIMPVYNGEKFLPAALESVLMQSFSDFEILLINDGSTDGSSRLCQQYAMQDKRILYLEKENGGVAKARNIALHKAKGNYIMFIDADDIIYPNTLEKVYKEIKKVSPDIMRFEFNTIDEYENPLFPNYEARRRQRYGYKNYSATDFINKILRDEFFLCMNIFSIEIIRQHRICFLEGCTFMEDTDFILQYLEFAKKCTYIPIKVYGYRKYSNAVTNHFTQKNFNDVYWVFLRTYKMYIQQNDYDLSRAQKKVLESIGILLYGHVKKLGTEAIKKEIITKCTQNPIRTEWKTYLLFKDSFWKCLSIWHRIRNRLYH